jgi:hypothetical protein
MPIHRIDLVERVRVLPHKRTPPAVALEKRVRPKRGVLAARPSVAVAATPRLLTRFERIDRATRDHHALLDHERVLAVPPNLRQMLVKGRAIFGWRAHLLDLGPDRRLAFEFR